MKKNTLKFWFKNRMTALIEAWILFAFAMTNNPYINALVFTILFFGSLFFMSHLFEDRHANSSERLMWIKLLELLR